MGCGLGKTLFYGLLNHPFIKQAVGVDYYRDVLEGAEKNATIMKMMDRIRFEHQDAATFDDFDADTNIVYLYNPFTEKPMQGLIENMIAHHEKTGSRFIVTYTKPLLSKMFKDAGWKEEPLIHALGREDDSTGFDDPNNFAVDPDLQLAVFTLGFEKPSEPQNS
jgi:SAM-dependent methyltransferase